MERFTVRSGDVELSCLDFGGNGSRCLILHGLAGSAREWLAVAARLANRHRVIGLDQRGHGLSNRPTGHYDRDAYVGDAIAVLDSIGGAGALIGQSMGGTNAFLAALARPDLVENLVVIEATASADPNAPREVQEFFDAWPVPFTSTASAREYFGSIGLAADGWIENLVPTTDGLRPNFKISDMVASVMDDARIDYGDRWRELRLPTLVVSGADSHVSADELREMANALPKGEFVSVPGAGHDVHLDQPGQLVHAIESFLDGH